ncbi:MAG: hypothetical protein KA362_01165 [Chloroflexi bacterium]|nr:hypothetical protein [Chloroflexota bacterium]MBK6710783.1 hypothetical protein [Chloroflexota bacterium]MBK7176466.1 hypothetical protein [Chloroflexota bacterium]MBK7915447.1 hypothetical protein [Chloroflexota bacterium]MBK8933911.1 hypothetical protein [Chloroflexota bacterium]
MDDDSDDAMIGFEKEAHSFVIRIWKEPTGETGEWRGWINHVQTGQRHYFRSPAAISPIIADYLHNQQEAVEGK